MRRGIIIAGVVAAALLGVLLVLRPWSGDSAAETGTSWQQQLGCTSITEVETEELYALALYTCTGPDGETNVYTFTDNTARDQWSEIAAQVGAVILAKGDGWVQAKV